MNGRTNAKNGAGAIRNGCAVLEIKASAHSQITAVRADGLTKKQDKGYIDSSNSNFWFYYIIIQKFELSGLEWTVTATNGTDTAIKTVIIDDHKKYTIKLPYKFYIVKNGIDVVPFLFSGASGSQGADTYNVHTPSSDAGCAYCAVDVYNFTSLFIEIVDPSRSYISAYSPYFGLCDKTPTITNHRITNMNIKTEFPGRRESNHKFIYPGTYDLEVSNYTGTYYIGLNFEGWTGQVGIITIKNFWLE